MTSDLQVGTPYYMAPELIHAKVSAADAADCHWLPSGCHRSRLAAFHHHGLTLMSTAHQ